MTLKRKDLRDQLTKILNWIPGDHRKCFGPSAAVAACWAFNLDLHPQGYHQIAHRTRFAATQGRMQHGKPGKADSEDEFGGEESKANVKNHR